MATYYVRKTGNDSNAGTSPGAAWLTITKALGASGIESGDTVYIGAGTYRETVNVQMTSATAETKVIGDVTGEHTGDAGEVLWTGYTTDDESGAGATSTCLLSGRDYLTFEHLTMVASTVSTAAPVIDGQNVTDSTNITLRRCTFLAAQGGASRGMIEATASFGTTLNWLIEECVFVDLRHAVSGFWGVLVFKGPCSASGAHYDLGIAIRNCMVLGGSWGVYCERTGGDNTNKPGGVLVENCTMLWQVDGCVRASNSWSTTIPAQVRNSMLISPRGTALSAATSGMLTEDWNYIYANTNRTNVSAGSDSVARDGTNAYAPMLEFGQALMRGARARAFGEPTVGSPYLGFGSAGSPPTVDLFGRPRPAGGPILNAVGALERSNSGVRETTVVRTGSSSLRITGPGYHDFELPVEATATEVKVWARYDSDHGATNKPQIQVRNGEECGVAEDTETMAAAADTWEELTLSFTPASRGIVTIRCISRAAAANGNAYFDD